MTTVNLKLYAQGAYVGSGEMAAEQTVTVTAHVSNGIVETQTATLATDGTCSVEFEAEGIFYLGVRTQNTLQVFTSGTVTLNGTAVNYDFTTAAEQAYGDNQVEVESGVFALYSGDIDSTGTIDTLDYDAWESAYNAYVEGGECDLNSDGLVDGADYVIYEANMGKSVAYPESFEIGAPNPHATPK